MNYAVGLRYRPDIDGLRAFAVLSVMLCHLQILFFSGGYVGVDVFFVISGFLITSILVRGLEAGTFSLIEFYEKRARRILPAFLVVATMCVFGSFFVPDASFIKEFHASVIASFIFLSNIFFWSKGGYFDAPSQQKPFLHTWSLSIEEQFYVFFPMLLFVVWRYYRHRVIAVLCTAWLASFVFSVVGVIYRPEMTFYMLHTRAWELLTGAILAVHMHRGVPVLGDRTRNLLSVLACVLLFLPVFLYDEKTPFPGPAALPACLGALLVIRLGGQAEAGFVNRLFSFRPVVLVGVISYSLYLWHWPVWIFLNQVFYTSAVDRGVAPIISFAGGAASAPGFLFHWVGEHVRWVAFVLTMAAGWLSWRFVEVPVRYRWVLSSRRGFAAVLAGAFLMVSALAVTQVLYPQNPIAALFFGKYSVSVMDKPDRQPGERITVYSSGGRDGLAFFAIGDSHLGMYTDMLDDFARDMGIAWAGVNAPFPLLNLQHKDSNGVLRNEFFEFVKNRKIRHVLISARFTWHLSADEVWWKDGRKSPGLYWLHASQVADGVQWGRETSLQGIRMALEDTIAYAREHGIHLWIVMPSPEMGFDVPNSLQATHAAGGDVSTVGVPWDVYMERGGAVRDLFKAYESDMVHIIDPAVIVCGGGFCRTEFGGKSLYSDDDHFSNAGTAYVRKAFVEFFSAVGQ